MGDNKVTIQDIADRAGVSKSTVSRYLNRGYVSAEKAERIRAVIDETGFQSNFFASRLKTKRSKLIGLVLPRIQHGNVDVLLQGNVPLRDAHRIDDDAVHPLLLKALDILEFLFHLQIADQQKPLIAQRLEDAGKA